MPIRTVRLHVSNNDRTGGVLRVTVNPWRVHIDAGDVVQWEIDKDLDPKNDIEWFRVERIEPAKAWPFIVEPPHPSYTGTKAGPVTANRGSTAASAQEVVTYGLTIGFKDDAANHRIMYIDPDMVIDS